MGSSRTCRNCGSNQHMMAVSFDLVMCAACQLAKKRDAEANGNAPRPLSLWGPQLGISVRGNVLEDISASTSSTLRGSNRMQRLRSNQRTLYHQTTPEVARLIVHEQQMQRGDRGMAGGAIYFATSAADTAHKATQHGTVLAATVLLGMVKTLPKDGDKDLTLSVLTSEGYDSALIPRDHGYEYVVYHTDQVKDIRLYSQ